MEYSLTCKAFRTFYDNRYIKECSASCFSFKEDTLNMGVLKMSVSEWKTPSLKAHLIQTESHQDIHLMGGTTGEFAMLHFVCDGQTIVEKNKMYPTTIKQNTNNMFCPTSEKVNHAFKKGEVNSYFKVFLPYAYIYSMVEKHPDLFADLSIMVKNRCPFLKEGNITTTLEMKMIIEQIKNSSTMGNVAPLYFETKIQELLALQLHQVNRFNCSECKSCKHYYDQLNEARNILEKYYQNPPTIAELARRVGMSETVLKSNFKSLFGTTVYGYLFDYRMGIARDLLSDKKLSIGEVAYKSGYENPSHFATAFKRKYGTSPKGFILA